jgi:magnesium chelatase family protein
MKLRSLIENANRLEVAEVEIEFIPGIPQIHFLGLPDRIIKESFYRIKSALKSAGFKFPLTSQVIVNIKPSHLRKSSRGVELAVALGILMKTEQIEASVIKPDWVIYGELGLDGRVYEPSDLNQSLFQLRDLNIVTGSETVANESCTMQIWRLEDLKNFEVHSTQKNSNYARPVTGLNKLYSKDEAEFLFIVSVTGLHALLAGDAGAGKSTLARSLVCFMPDPEESELIRVENQWRPVVSPHQSITPAAFLGGGAQIYEGEVERAQGGILLLDEMLEFDPEILESLRGPMTGEKFRLSRASQHREISSQFQVVATTNLCPCGKWTPMKSNVTCRFSRVKCTRQLEKFSGPLLDRFGLIMFCPAQVERKISGHSVLDRIEKFYKAKMKYKMQIETSKVDELYKNYYSHLSSRRRKALEKIAQVYAVEEVAKKVDQNGVTDLSIEMNCLTKAEKWSVRPFELLEKGMG